MVVVDEASTARSVVPSDRLVVEQCPGNRINCQFYSHRSSLTEGWHVEDHRALFVGLHWGCPFCSIEISDKDRRQSNMTQAEMNLRHGEIVKLMRDDYQAYQADIN